MLYFIPAVREALLATVPDPGTEFCLVDEAALLARMLGSARGGAVAASNVLRALRQSRQAAALGLLEGHAHASHGSVDIEVTILLPPVRTAPHQSWAGWSQPCKLVAS